MVLFSLLCFFFLSSFPLYNNRAIYLCIYLRLYFCVCVQALRWLLLLRFYLMLFFFTFCIFLLFWFFIIICSSLNTHCSSVCRWWLLYLFFISGKIVKVSWQKIESGAQSGYRLHSNKSNNKWHLNAVVMFSPYFTFFFFRFFVFFFWILWYCCLFVILFLLFFCMLRLCVNSSFSSKLVVWYFFQCCRSVFLYLCLPHTVVKKL